MEPCGAATPALPEPPANPPWGQVAPSPAPHPHQQVSEVRCSLNLTGKVGNRVEMWGEGRASVGMDTTTADLCLVCLTAVYREGPKILLLPTPPNLAWG